MSVQDRLAKLEQHAEYAQAMRHQPKSASGMIVALGIALAVGGGVLGVMATTSLARGAGWLLALVGVVGIAIQVFFASTPLERVLAEVAEGWPPKDFDPDSAGTAHPPYVTLERIDGVKRDYRVSSKLGERLREGDAGVGYFKAGFLIDFRPLK